MIDSAKYGQLGRLAGVGAVVGAFIWPLAIGNVAATAIPAAQPGIVPNVASSIGPLAIALLLFGGAIATLELRATEPIGLWDLIGDLTIGGAALVLGLAAMLGLPDLVGPGFVLLFIGSLVFGAAGSTGARRPRWGSALVATGAVGMVAGLLAAGSLGPERPDPVTQTALLGVLLYAIGWGWLGIHLARVGGSTRL